MAVSYHLRRFAQRQINPRLGIYYGIFASAFAGLMMLLVMLEQLGYPDRWVKLAMVAAPAAFAAVIGISAFSSAIDDYFVAGRRVPALFNGLVIAVTTLGATGLLAVTGSFFFIGADALCLTIGYFAGCILAGVMLVPYLRKLGAYTLPSYLGRRFESRLVRIVAAVLLAVPVLLILVAELRVGAAVVKSVLGVNRGNLIWPAAIAICITVAPGGMRSLTWSNVAWALIAFIALLVPISILAVLLTNLPLPQLTYGGLLRDLGRLEAANGVIFKAASGAAFTLPDFGSAVISRPFAEPFSAIGPWGFMLASLTIMCGTAALPSLLVRSGTTPGVFEARKSMVWTAFFLGLMLLTLPAIAVFARYLVLSEIVGTTTDRMPEWLAALLQTGQAQVDMQAPRITLQSLRFRRDFILLALPALAGFPAVMGYVAASGIVAAALAGASCRLVTLANMLSEDLLFGARRVAPASANRILAARLALALAAAIAAWLALQWTVDPLRLVLWAMSLAAATALPVLALSIWWKRINKSGAFFGMIAGFIVTGLYILLDFGPDGRGWFAVDNELAAVFGMPVGIAICVVVSLLTPAPSPHVKEIIRDMRVPGGETIHDRELRLSKDGQPAAA